MAKRKKTKQTIQEPKTQQEIEEITDIINESIVGVNQDNLNLLLDELGIVSMTQITSIAMGEMNED